MQKRYRLKGEKTFNTVYRKGQNYGSKYLVLLFVKNKGGIKVGFNVSKKVGNSVTRNLVRRRLRASFRLMIPNIEQGYNFVVVAKSASSEASYATLNANLEYLLKKAGKISL